MGKQYVSMYECPKCNKTIYFRSNIDVPYTHCKTCGTELKYHWTQTYRPNQNLKTINKINSNGHISPTYNYNSSTPIITCPYCQSTNCKKISGLSKAVSVGLWGIFALGKTTKQWHCNNCGSDF